MKLCRGCNQVLALSEFGPRKFTKDGLKSQCKRCLSDKQKERYRSDPYRHRSISRAYYARNSEVCREKARERLSVGGVVEHRKSYMAEYRARPEAIAKRRESVRLRRIRNPLIGRKESERRRKRRNEDIAYRLKEQVRCGIRLKLKKYLQGKGAQTDRLLGCNAAELKAHLERQFLPGMSWDNWGRGRDKWNIDHIVPAPQFDFSKIEDQLAYFNFMNLQPLWEPDNLAKGANIEFVMNQKLVIAGA